MQTCGTVEVPACNVSDVLAYTSGRDRDRLQSLPIDRMCASLYERTPHGAVNACTAKSVRVLSPCKRGESCEPRPLLGSEHFEWRFATLKEAPPDVMRMYGLYLRGEFGANKKSAIASALWNDMEAEKIADTYEKLLTTLRRYPRKARRKVNSSTRILPTIHVEWNVKRAWFGGSKCDVQVVDAKPRVDDQSPLPSSAHDWQVCDVFISRKDSEEGHAVMIAAHSGRVYAYDPNGKELHTDYDGSFKVEDDIDSAHSVVVLLALDAARRHMGWRGRWWRSWYTHADNWLLDVGMGQSGVVRYLDSKGICGAYVWYVMTLLVLNPSCTAESLARFVSYRQSQWQSEAVSDDRLKLTLQKLRMWQPGELSEITLQMMSLFTLMDDERTHCFTQAMETEMERLKVKLGEVDERMQTEQEYHQNLFETSDKSIAATNTFNAFVDRYNADRKQHEEMRLRYNELVGDKKSALKLDNVLLMIDGCDNVADTLHRYIYDTAWELFQRMKINPGAKTRLRQKMVSSGIFLNFLEVQIFSFITHCAESALFPQRDVKVDEARGETSFRACTVCAPSNLLY